jgi:hypothetical protein
MRGGKFGENFKCVLSGHDDLTVAMAVNGKGAVCA